MNKCTLLIDGNWILQSRVSVLFDKFEIQNPLPVKQAAADELKEMIARSIHLILNRFQCIDNIILVSDGGSWRKQLPIPNSISTNVYKGNRQSDKEYDWNLIFKTFNNFVKHCKDIGITCTQYFNIEGDDWIWYWSRRLNSQGIHCIIWSVDNDLKQLVQKENETGAWTVWYNDKNGLWINDVLKEQEVSDIDFFMTPPQYHSVILENLKNHSKGTVNYINPDDIILSKIICGDSGDNIKSVFRYMKNGRTYRVSEKEWSKISKEYNISSIDRLLNYIPETASAIANHKKYKNFKPSISDIEEMINYNIKLVWLNENVIPDTLVAAMNQQEYKQYDISYIKSNFKVLLDTNDEDYVKQLFNEF